MKGIKKIRINKKMYLFLLILKQKIIFLLNIVCTLKQLKEVLYNGLDKMPPKDGKQKAL